VENYEGEEEGIGREEGIIRYDYLRSIY